MKTYSARYSQETLQKMSDAAKQRIKRLPHTLPSNTGRFKENPGYLALHAWIRKQRGAPKVCEHCGATKDLQWANKTGKYLRELDDWLPLCRSCHRRYDIRNNVWKHPRFV